MCNLMIAAQRAPYHTLMENVEAGNQKERSVVRCKLLSVE